MATKPHVEPRLPKLLYSLCTFCPKLLSYCNDRKRRVFESTETQCEALLRLSRISGNDVRGLERATVGARVAAPWRSAGPGVPRQRVDLRQVRPHPCGAVDSCMTAAVLRMIAGRNEQLVIQVHVIAWFGPCPWLSF